MATDPYRYFRVEARELVEGLGQGILELEKGSNDAAIGPRLFRFAHTLKGAARVVRRRELAELAHAVEEILARTRDESRSATPAELTELLALVDRMAEGLRQLDAPPPAKAAPAAAAPAAPAPQAAPHEDAFQTVRIEIEEMDSVLRAVTETGVQLAALTREVARVRQLALVSAALVNRLALRADAGPAAERDQALGEELQNGLERAAQGLEAGVERVAQELAEVREGADRLRLVPAEALFPSLRRAVRDAAHALERRAELAAIGGSLRLDAHVLGPLRAALLHLVRNAVAHGIEAPSERAAAGKPEQGTVSLRVERRADRVVFACSDDGRGIDVRAVRRALVARGLADAAELTRLPDEVVLERLLAAGISTTTSVTPIAGRGVGLDVVRETARHLSGEVTVRTQAGRGTTIELSVPVSLAAVRALVVEAGATTAAIPLDSVRETRRMEAGALGRTPEGDVVSLDGKILPFLPLGRALRQPGAFDRAAARSVVVLAVGERTAVVGVDRLLGTFDVIVRPLPHGVVADAVIAGAALDDEGNPRLLLDAEALLAAAGSSVAANVEAEAPDRLPILVIDDSLTTRMLEQSILESAGYAVEVAVSAEQGLKKARQKPYGLFIVDVEMPGMNGFEFVALTRADAELRRVPAILVSSRDAPEDLKKGQESGASAYVVKGEFDQNLLLSHISKATRVTMGKTRVLVVEDSLTVRARLLEVLASDPSFEVVGEAGDGRAAIELCERLRPDVVTLDMMLPVMTGLAATEYIMAHFPTPILVVSSSFNRGEVFKTYDALAAGAVDVIEKPRGDEEPGVWERQFLSAVRVVSRVRVVTHRRLRAGGPGERPNSQPPAAAGAGAPRLALIGVSTGGPSALVEVLRALPPDFPAPVLVVMHLAAAFATAFADWLGGQIGRRVAYAADGESVEACRGEVRLGPPDRHLIVRGGRLRLTHDPERHSCRPSVDVLFESVAREEAATTVACLLTGMGRDGALGLLELRRGGAVTIGQDEASSVVYGMPREAALIGAVEHVLPLVQVGPFLVALFRGQGRTA